VLPRTKRLLAQQPPGLGADHAALANRLIAVAVRPAPALRDSATREDNTTALTATRPTHGSSRPDERERLGLIGGGIGAW
jgi:hypothetical protein